MDIYDKLGVKKIINACGFATELGGAIMAPEVLEAMTQASRSHVDMRELHEKAGKRIAELVGAEAACITGCAAAGLCISVAACITGKDLDKVKKIPEIEGDRKEVIIQRTHRNPFDHAIRQTGAKLVVIGTKDDVTSEDLKSAINKNTVAMVYVHDTHLPSVTLPFQQVVEICHGSNVPLVVDTAAELPPPANLQNFLKQGADLVVFSGGRASMDPNHLGLY
jgi:L-seryl-tRNA(Ser) seleniumtransferase